MTGQSNRWRALMLREKRLLTDLSLMIATALIIGMYFLENVSVTLEHTQRQSNEALAQQVANSASEYLVTSNLVSLNVIATHTVNLKPVSQVEIVSAAGDVLARAGDEAPDMQPVSRGIRIDEDVLAGEVRIWPASDVRLVAERLETRFVLITLCLLALRVLVSLVQRRLEARDAATDDETDEQDMEADILPVLSMGSAASGGAKAWLRISIVNFDRYRERFTDALMSEMLAGYQQRLQQVASVYGARVVSPLGEQAALEFSAGSRSDACFQALCAGMLLRQLVREYSDHRKNHDKTPLEFKQLVTGMGNQDTSWALCSAGLPGRVHVPEQELVSLELDARVLFKPERCLVITAVGHELRVQPIEQLAQRYQRLVSEQARKLGAASPA